MLSLGGDLYLETDVSDRDRFGRLLRYVWLDFGDGEVYLVNEALVRAGYAAFSTFPPDVKYVAEIREAGQLTGSMVTGSGPAASRMSREIPTS